MAKKTSIMAKVFKCTLCLILLISIGLNIYQYQRFITDRKNNIDMASYYMREYEVTFHNALHTDGKTDLLEFIKYPDHLSNLIEGILVAESDYLAASKFDPKNPSTIRTRSLLTGYLSELRTYRIYLEGDSNGSYEDINKIKITISDLQFIASWLDKKASNKDYKVYSDKDFLTEVYDRLKNTDKAAYFIVN